MARSCTFHQSGRCICFQLPFVPWVSYFPGLAELMNRSPQEINETTRGWFRCEGARQTASALESTDTPAAGSPSGICIWTKSAGVAGQLHISVATVDSHRDKIVEQCKLVWEDQAGEQFSAKFLERRFGPFLAGYK